MERKILRGMLYVVLVYASIGAIEDMSPSRGVSYGEKSIAVAFAVGALAALAISARPEQVLPTSQPPAAAGERPAKVVERRPT